MNTRFLVHSILAVASLASFNAAAADLKEIYERALTNDPLIREADANRLAARESKPQAISALLPQIQGSGQYRDTESDGTSVDINPPNPPAPFDRLTTGNSTSWDLTLRQNVFRWENWAALRRADSEQAQAEADYVVAQQDLILRTSEAYFNVLAARDTLEAAQAAHEAIGRQLEQSEKRFEVGLIAVTDVQDAKAAFDSATAGLIQAKRNLATSGEILRELTGDAYDELERPGSDMPLAGPNPANDDDWVKLAMEQNARLTASRLAADVTRHNISIEQGGYIPSIDFLASKSWFESEESTLRGTVTGEGDSDFEDTVYGVQLTVPIFTGGATSSRVRQAQYRNIAARERLERTARETERLTRDAYLGINSEVARVQSLNQAVESAKTALQATEAGYEVGTRTSVDVLEARRRLFDSQTNYARSRYDYLLNVLRLQLAAGTLDPESLADINALLTENVSVTADQGASMTLVGARRGRCTRDPVGHGGPGFFRRDGLDEDASGALCIELAQCRIERAAVSRGPRRHPAPYEPVGDFHRVAPREHRDAQARRKRRFHFAPQTRAVCDRKRRAGRVMRALPSRRARSVLVRIRNGPDHIGNLRSRNRAGTQ